MTGKRLYVLAMLAAIVPALIVTMPAPQAHAKDGRNAAFVFGLVTGAVGAAILYDHHTRRDVRWSRVRNHYHRGYYGRCHIHNGVRHCHRARNYRPARTYYAPQRSYRPKPWTKRWYRYCLNKYRSFNPRTGYYRTYSGKRRFCR